MENCAKCAIKTYCLWPLKTSVQSAVKVDIITLMKVFSTTLQPCKAEGVFVLLHQRNQDRNDEAPREKEQWHHSLPN